MSQMIPNRTSDESIPDPTEIESDNRRDDEILADRPPHHG